MRFLLLLVFLIGFDLTCSCKVPILSLVFFEMPGSENYMHAVSLSVNAIISCYIMALGPATKFCFQDVEFSCQIV